MTTSPPALPFTYDQDAEHLKILSICWYVYAALHAFGACILLLYIAFGIVIALFGLAAGATAAGAAHHPAPFVLGLPFAGIGLLFACLFGLLFLLLLTLAFLDFHCARSLSRRKNLTLCYVMSAIVCINMPFGTALGVFTLIVLSRPTVKALFK